MNYDKTRVSQNTKYLETHNITGYIEEMMSQIVKEKPEEPVHFMVRFFQKRLNQNASSQSIIQMSDSPTDNSIKMSDGYRQQSSTNKSYGKPWKSGSIRKGSNSNNTNTDNSFNNNIAPSRELVNENDSLCEEFNLVEETKVNDDQQMNSKIISNSSKFIRHSNKTKDLLLKLITDEKLAKINEQACVENKMKSKEEIFVEYDSAVELAEDPELYCNEFQVTPVTNTKGSVSQTGVLIKKPICSAVSSLENTTIKFGLCNNCTKFYQLNNNETIQMTCEQDWAMPKGFIISEDIESASQVSGPRMISADQYPNSGRLKINKKISVSDIETTSKPWPVPDTSSESSTIKAGMSRVKLSSRHFAH